MLSLFWIISIVLFNNVLCLDLKFQQTDFQLKFERIEAVSFNKAYVKNFKIATFKYNRTSTVVNSTMEYNIDIGNELELIAQAYVFLSNEYRNFPMRFEFNFCEAMSKNVAGMNSMTKCGNFTECPLKKARIYHMCNWNPDPSYLPPFIPNGAYMAEFQGLYHDKEVFVMRTYATVYRPIPIPVLEH